VCRSRYCSSVFRSFSSWSDMVGFPTDSPARMVSARCRRSCYRGADLTRAKGVWLEVAFPSSSVYLPYRPPLYKNRRWYSESGAASIHKSILLHLFTVSIQIRHPAPGFGAIIP
jgi:hypothetical protein